jgi:hypothetical protein
VCATTRPDALGVLPNTMDTLFLNDESAILVDVPAAAAYHGYAVQFVQCFECFLHYAEAVHLQMAMPQFALQKRGAPMVRLVSTVP